MSNVPHHHDPGARDAHALHHGRPPAAGAGRLRLARPEAGEAAISGRIAHAARMLHGWLIFALAGNVMVLQGAEGSLSQRLAAAIVAGTVFLAAFRLERRNITFARLSGLAQGVYRTRAVITGALALASIAYFMPWLQIRPAEIVVCAAALVLLSAIWGLLTRSVLGGRRVHRTLIIGDGEKVGRFVAEFARDPHPDYMIAGLLTETGSGGAVPSVEGDTTLEELVSMFDEGITAPAAPVLGSLDDLETVLAAEAIDTVVVAVRRNRLELFARLSGYEGADITVQELPAFSEHVFGRVPVDVINAAWFMHMIHPFYRPYSRLAKRVGDIAASLLIGICALPVLPVAALLVKLTSAGPVLYSQRRVGEHGREFRIYKFRTMVQDAEAAGAQYAQENDPRVTRVGAVFRATRIDELPQLWNILLGHMSFVGPRPERPEFVTELEQCVPYYQRRHLVKPGLTGWAQVRLGYADSVDGAANKLGFELYYLKHQSLFLDFLIFVETIRVVLLRFGSR